MLVFLVLYLSQEARAQFSGATVTGVVQDSSKAVVPSARLRLINTETGAENDADTNREGGFVLDGVLPGSYTLQVECTGFATTQVRNLVLAGGDTRNFLIRLKVGSVAETVSVDASGLVMNTTTAAVGLVANRKLVESVPLNGRSFPDFILLTPGIVTQSPQAAAKGNSTVGELSVNGQQPEANSFFVDGIVTHADLGAATRSGRLAATGSNAGTTAVGTTQTLVSVEALQEFRALTSTYSAEYGRTPGGQFDFVTRSGMEGFHGSAYNYYRRDALQGLDHFQSIDHYRINNGYNYNQFDSGVTLGGPWKLPWEANRKPESFLFGSYEGLYLAQPTPYLFQYLPAYSIESSAPTEIQNIVNDFGAGDPEILDANGNPTGLAYASEIDHTLPSHVNAASLRLDRVLGPNASVFARYADTASFGQTDQVSSLTQNRVHDHAFTLGSTLQMPGGKNNELRVGLGSESTTSTTNVSPKFQCCGAFTDLLSLLGVPLNYGSVRGQVYIHGNGAGDTFIQTNQDSGSLTQWNLRDTLAMPLRNHLLKIGFDELWLGGRTVPAALSVEPNFFTRSSLINDSVSQLIVSNSKPASPERNQLSLFADDTWKIRSALNLSLGLRWDLSPAPQGKHGQNAFTALGNVALPATLTLAPRGTPLWDTTWFNFAPRVGAAWVARNTSGRELVVRGGAGVFFDTSEREALHAFHGVGFYSSRAFIDVPLPVTPSQLEVSTAIGPSYNNTLVFAFPRHLQTPYSLQWNLSLEKALGQHQSLTVSYVGASGRRLLREQRRDVNAINPDFSEVSYYPGGLGSNYEALQVKFQRTFRKGVEALGSYTWAHALDYGSTSPQFPLRYASSDLDVRHNLEAGLSWILPPKHEHLLTKIFVGDWTMDSRLFARTAFPINLNGNFFFDTVTGEPYYSGVDLVPNHPLYYRDPTLAGGRGLNGGPLNNRPLLQPAFTLPLGDAAGDAPRNLVRGFGLLQLNIGAHRTFPVHDRLHLDIGAEMFNVTNHPNFGYIDPNLTDSVFGQAIRMLDQSFGSTGALYQEGGPRATQLHVRFVF